MRLNWDKEAGQEYQVYPAGTYKVKITGYEETTAKTGTKQIRWKTTIVEPQAYFGKQFTTHTALTENALWRIAKLVRACGMDTKALGECDTNGSAFYKALTACVGRTSYWNLSVKPDNKGNDRNEVEDFKLDEGQPTPAEADEDVPEFLK